MSTSKTFILIIAIVFISFFTGCKGSNGGSSTTSTDPATSTYLILQVSTEEVTTNNEIVNISVSVYDEKNTPYTGGTVTVAYPDSVRDGRDVGSFENIEVPVTNGVANFVYTAPSNLYANESDILFTFTHDSNLLDTKTYTVTINPIEGQKELASYTIQSDINTSVEMGLESDKLVTFLVQNDKNKLVLDLDMISMTVSLMNPNLGTLKDNAGNTGTSLTINNRNNITINVNSGTKSGLMPIQVETIFKDINGDEQTLSKVFNILVLSGPPSAMSLSYSGTEQASERAKFIEKWVLTVTDKYNNLVNTNPAVSMGMIAGFANDSSNTASNSENYLFFSPDETSSGTLNADSDSFIAQAAVFDDVDLNNDVLVTFGSGFTFNASGMWDISAKSSNILGLDNDYTSENTSGLGFAVGHNSRDKLCSDTGASAVANVYSANDNYIIDSTGSLIINVEYDYYLTGKSTILWVNLVGKNYKTDETVRIGEAEKMNLRAMGLTAESPSYSSGYQGNLRVNVLISNTVAWYQNAKFSYNVEAADDLNWTISGSSNDNNLSDCSNSNGRGYVDILITSPAPTGGTLTLTNLLPAWEF